MSTPGYLDIAANTGIVTRFPPATTPTPNAIPGLDGSGLLPIALMPAGTQLQTHVATVGGAEIAAGKFVNINPADGTARLADAANGFRAQMFALQTYAGGASNAVFYLLGKNTAVTIAGGHIGRVWLGTAGGFVTAPPQVGSGGVVAGHMLQPLGAAFQGATPYIAFEPDEVFILNV